MKEEKYAKALTDSKQNWLAEELKRERRISVWDLDDNAKSLELQHREHCEAREIEREHEEIHSQQGPARPQIYSTKKPINNIPYRRKTGVNPISVIVIIVFLSIFFNFILIFLSVIFD